MANLDFKCALITGGGGGIGKALAEYLISSGKEVILAGRTEPKLQEAAKEIGAKTYYVLDTGDIDSIPSFVSKITKEHPQLDCLINNAGVQRPLNANGDPKEFLEKADQEININIRGPMHLCLSLLSHFKSQQKGALIINVSSILGFVPFSIINPVYNGTKAWLHFFTLNLRTQLKDSKIKVVEIAPPAVGTDLHREREDPDDNKKHKNPDALSIEEFMDEVKQGMSGDSSIVTAGPGKKVIEKWYEAFGERYDQAASGYKPS